MTYDKRGLVTKVENEIPSTPYPFRKNFALGSSGATGSASSLFSSSYSIAGAFNGQRAGTGWTTSPAAGWSSTSYGLPAWLQTTFDGEKTIDEINVVTVQNNYGSPVEPDENTTFSQYGIVNFDVQYWDGDSWETVPGGSVTSNNKVLKKFTFSPISTTKVRVSVSSALGSSTARITELEAWGPDETAPPVDTETNFTYDDLGNRTGMTDEMGSTAYTYDSLSRLKDETRSFVDSLPNAPLTGNSFKIQYQYTLSGALKKITDPFGDEINYASDKSGRLKDVTGSTYANLTEYAENAQYTAWGGLKGLTYGNDVQMATSFDNRNRPDAYQLTGPSSTPIMNKAYDYYNDGRLKFVDDGINAIFDRLQTYDHAGRVKEGKSGAEASGGSVATENQSTQLPYRQSYGFNTFGDMTQRNNLHWGKDTWQGQSNNLSYTYENGRVAGYQYDADGRALLSYEGGQTFYSAYDARGLLISFGPTGG